jgi:signal transduction histidine kinase
MNQVMAKAFRLKAQLSGVQWRWVLLAGVAAPVMTLVLWVVVVMVYAAILAALARGAPDGERIGAFASQGQWAGRVLALGLTVGGASWAARRAGTLAVRHGVLVGLVSGLSAPLVWWFPHGYPQLWEVATVMLSAGAGWMGGLEARSAIAGQEALYRSSRAISGAQSPQAIVAAIGEYLAESQMSKVALWQVVSQAEDGSPSEVVLLASWTPGAENPWPSGLRLQASQMPLLRGLRKEGPTSLEVNNLPASERAAWEQMGIHSAVLLPLTDRDETWTGLIMVASQTPRSFSRCIRGGITGKYLAMAPQAALALENLRLIEQGKQIGVLAERQRLAREIHDTLAQGFTSIVMHLEAAEQVLSASPERAHGHLDRARSTARASLAEARRVVWALRPDILEGAPLHEAIKRLAGRWSDESGIATITNVTGTPRPLPVQIEVTLLRTVQETLTNVRKHANAGNVAVTLSYMEDMAALDVRDDGLGFDPAQDCGVNGSAESGFGLVAMRERVEQQGGKMIVESAPGEGTTIAVELPVAQYASAPVEAATVGETI